LTRWLRPELGLPALQIYQVNPTTKPKTYTWFYQSSNLAAARSSAGGLALMRK
jgi:hypothetical protein